MYINQGYRGLSIIPYPKHVRDMIHDISQKTRRIDPEYSKTIIYKGSEIIPNFDKNLVKMKKEIGSSIFARVVQENKDDSNKAASQSLVAGLDHKLKKKLSLAKKSTMKVDAPKQVVIQHERPCASLDVPRRDIFKISNGIDAVTGKMRKNIFYNPEVKPVSKR